MAHGDMQADLLTLKPKRQFLILVDEYKVSLDAHNSRFGDSRLSGQRISLGKTSDQV